MDYCNFILLDLMPIFVKIKVTDAIQRKLEFILMIVQIQNYQQQQNNFRNYNLQKKIRMLQKKIVEKSETIKIQQMISLLCQSDPNLSNPILQSTLNCEQLQPYFRNLHLYVNSANLLYVKRYEILNQGIYILLKGQISFMFNERSAEKQKSFIHKSKTINRKNSSGVMVVNNPYSVFECMLKNCTCLQECVLLKINEEQATLSKFYDLFNQRNDLYQNHFLAYDHQNVYQYDHNKQIFRVNMKLHSNLVSKTFKFRQIINLNTIAIVSEGRAKLKLPNHHSHQFERYGVILPNTAYQVTSAQIVLMVILSYETVYMKINCEALPDINQHEQLNSIKSSKSSFHKINSKSSHLVEHTLSRKERQKRDKQIAKFSKQSQSFSIISSFLCNKSLHFAKKQNLLNHTKEKKRDRFKNPLILFSIVNEKSKLAIPNFCDTTNVITCRPKPKYIQSYKHTSTEKQKILKKIRLPNEEYSKIIEKHKNQINKLKRQLNQSNQKQLPKFKKNEDQQQLFLRYQQNITQ